MKFLLAIGVIAVLMVACEGEKKVEPNDQVSTTLISWSRSEAFGLTMDANFKFTNNTTKHIKDVEVECVGYSETNTKIDSNRRTVYKSIAPGQTITVSKFDMGFISSNVRSEVCRTIRFITI